MRYLILLLIIVFISMSEAKVWRVDKNTANKPDFTDLIAAYNAANAGDTLYVAGHGTSYGSIEINKQVVIIGPGYFLDQNLANGINPFEAQITVISTKSGAENTKVIGCSIKAVAIECNNIILKRDRITPGTIRQNGGPYSGIIIQQCYIWSWITIGGDNIVLSDNIILGVVNMSTSGLIKNNVITSGIFSPLELNGIIVENNILIDCPITSNNCIIRNNIAISSGEKNTVFTLTGNEDAQYILKDGSPAKGAGVNGVDCGAFGGDEPYVLSGIPPIPTIYEAVVPSSATNSSGLPVKIKARANK